MTGERRLAQVVQMLLEQRKWSYSEAARRTDHLDATTIWKIATGKTLNPTGGTLQQLAVIFGVSVDELAGSRPLRRRKVEIVGEMAKVPLHALRVQADADPDWADTSETAITDAASVRHRPNAFAAIVTGTCMVPQIMPGDRIFIDPDQQPQHRDTVVVVTEDGALLVKWFRLDGNGRPYLRAADGSQIRPNGARIAGVVFKRESDPIPDPEP